MILLQRPREGRGEVDGSSHAWTQPSSRPSEPDQVRVWGGDLDKDGDGNDR